MSLPDIETVLRDLVRWVESKASVTAILSDQDGPEPATPYVVLTEILNEERSGAETFTRQVVTDKTLTMLTAVEGETSILVVNRQRSEHTVEAGEDVNDVRDSHVSQHASLHTLYPTGNLVTVSAGAGDGEVRVVRGADLGSLRHARGWPAELWESTDNTTVVCYQTISRRSVRIQFDVYGTAAEVNQIARDLVMELEAPHSREALKDAGLFGQRVGAIRKMPGTYSDAQSEHRRTFDAFFNVPQIQTDEGPNAVTSAVFEDPWQT